MTAPHEHGPTPANRAFRFEGPGGQYSGLVAAAVLLLLTAVGVFVVDKTPAAVRAQASVTILMWVNIVIMLVALGIELNRRPYSLNAMMLLSLFLFLGAPAILQYTRGHFALAGPIDLYRARVLPAVFSVTVFILFYLAAYELRRALSPRLRSRDVLQRFLDRAVSEARATWVNVGSIVVLVYLGVVVGLAGASARGSALVAQSQHTASLDAQIGGGLVFFLIHQLFLRAFPFVALVAGVLVLRRRAMLARPALLMICVVATLGIVIADNPFAAQRIWLVTTLFGFAAPLVLGRMKTGWALAITSVAGLTILPALSANRNVTSFGEWLQWLAWIGLVSPYDVLARSTDSDMLGMLVLCFEWTERFGHMWGLQLLTGIFSWVPRSIWASKSVGTGGMVTEGLGFEFTNLSPPIMAEPIVDFGMIGVLPYAFAVGWLFCKLDTIYWSAPHDRRAPTRVIDVILPFWLGLTVLYVRGDFLAANAFFLAFTLWIAVLGVGAPPVAKLAEAAPPPPPVDDFDDLVPLGDPPVPRADESGLSA